MNPAERWRFKTSLLQEHKNTFGKVYFCQIFLDGIDYSRVELHAHHIFPAALWPERRLDISNGVLINARVHIALHQNHALEEVPVVLKDYVENNHRAYCRWYRNLILPNGRKFTNTWTAYLITKSLLDRPHKMF